MTDWDMQIIRDMERTVCKLQAALGAGSDARTGLYRVLIGDSRPMTRRQVESAIADNHRWIAEIKAQY